MQVTTPNTGSLLMVVSQRKFYSTFRRGIFILVTTSALCSEGPGLHPGPGANYPDRVFSGFPSARPRRAGIEH